MANKRLFYAVEGAAIAICGSNTFTNVHGLQSIGVNTKFNLEQVFEIGQLAIYETVENLPDIEIQMEKVLDGYPLLYHLGTQSSLTGTLVGRSNARATIGMSVYADTNESASGTPLAQCTMSGVYISSLAYNLQVNGNCTEAVTFVGNNKVWNNTFTATAFTNNDSPPASGGVQRRQHVLVGSGQSYLPTELPGVESNGFVYAETDGNSFKCSVQSIRFNVNLGREQLFELGRRGPYHRYVTFPVEVRTDIEINAKGGDMITARDDRDNLTNQKIYVKMLSGTYFDAGTKNKLSSVNHTGGNAGQNGGIATQTFSYINYNDFTVTDSADPSGL